jgi:hypothetical protein
VEAEKMQTAASKRTEKLFPQAYISVIYLVGDFSAGNSNYTYTVKIVLAFKNILFRKL